MYRELYTGYYKHFKGINNDGCEMVYYVHDICEDTETGEIKVFYQAMYGDMKRYVREISMFLSLTDTKKYPRATQKYRFEKMNKKEIKGWKQRNKEFFKEERKQRKRLQRKNDLITLMNI